jgi:hypothetical protein
MQRQLVAMLIANASTDGGIDMIFSTILFSAYPIREHFVLPQCLV